MSHDVNLCETNNILMYDSDAYIGQFYILGFYYAARLLCSIIEISDMTGQQRS